MNTVVTQPNNSRYTGLLRSLEGLRNGRASALLLGSDVIAVMIFLIGFPMNSIVASVLFGLVAFAISGCEVLHNRGM